MNRKNLLTISVQKVNFYLYRVVRQPSKRQILYSPIGLGNPEKLQNSIKRISRNFFSCFKIFYNFFLIKNADAKIIKRLYNRISWLNKRANRSRNIQKVTQCFAKLSQHYELKNNPKIKTIYHPALKKLYRLPKIYITAFELKHSLCYIT